MIFEVASPKILNPEDMDKLLETGWFRFSDSLFRSKYICIDGKISEIINIRLKLSDYKLKKSHKRIIKKFDETNYKIVFQKINLSNEKEYLYNLTKKKFKGFIVDNLSQFLFDNPFRPIYNTYELSVYDENNLIAGSFFDLGKYSMASLLAIYNPQYFKLSIGKFTMLKEIEFCLVNNIKYYYPGYILDNNKIFDYKMFLGSVECLDEKSKWVLFYPEKRTDNTGKIYKTINEIHNVLEKNKIKFSFKLNPFFTLGYFDNFPEKFIKGMFIFLIKTKYNVNYKFAVEYDFETNEFVLSFIKKTDAYNRLKEVQDNSYFEKKPIYLTDICIYDSFLLKSKSINQIINHLIKVKNFY